MSTTFGRKIISIFEHCDLENKRQIMIVRRNKKTYLVLRSRSRRRGKITRRRNKNTEKINRFIYRSPKTPNRRTVGRRNRIKI